MAEEDYDYYFAALRGDKPPVVETDPQAGFYKSRDGKPVAIFYESDRRHIARVGFKGETALYRAIQGKAEFDRICKVWMDCCNRPVEHEDYKRAFDAGKWPGALPEEAMGDVPAANRVVTRSDNQPPDEPEHQQFRDKIEAAKAVVSGLKIDNDDAAGKAQSARARLLELKRQADTRHKTVREPAKIALDDIDNLWKPVVKMAQDAADGIRGALTAWETKKLREAQIAAAEQARKDAEAKAAAEASGEPAPPPAEPEVPAEPEKPSVGIRGNYGRAASVRTKKVVTIRDQDAIYAVFRDNAKVGELLRTLAQKSVDDGFGLPAGSVTITEEADVR